MLIVLKSGNWSLSNIICFHRWSKILWATNLNMIVSWKLLTRWLITQDTDACSTENGKARPTIWQTPQFRRGICEKLVMWDGSTDISELFSLKLRINNPKYVSFIAVLHTTSLTRCLVMAVLELPCSVPRWKKLYVYGKTYFVSLFIVKLNFSPACA